MKFDVGGGRVKADHVEDSLDHMGLCERDGAVGVTGEASAEVVLEVAIVGEVEFRLEGGDLGRNEGEVRAEETGVVHVKDKSNVVFCVKACVDTGWEPAPGD